MYEFQTPNGDLLIVMNENTKWGQNRTVPFFVAALCLFEFMLRLAC